MLQMKDLLQRPLGAACRSAAFARRSRRLVTPHAVLVAACFLVPAVFGGRLRPPVTAFKPKTFAAFTTYVDATEARNSTELRQAKDLLWIDALPAAARTLAYESLAHGEIQIEQRRVSKESGRAIPCPDGMIHHWEGLVFIPGAHLEDVLTVLQDYNRHSSYYAPDVVRSRIESRDADHFRVFLRLRRQKVITVVLNTEHDVRYFLDSAKAAHSRSSAIHIAEVENPGKDSESEKPREQDNGFLWGMETWWRILEKDGGVYVQSEVVSLTRDIPTGLGWMIGPFITSIPKDSLSFTLEATRKAVLALPAVKASANQK